jgi:V8-like Glu-specific endopeptidase
MLQSNSKKGLDSFHNPQTGLVGIQAQQQPRGPTTPRGSDGGSSARAPRSDQHKGLTPEPVTHVLASTTFRPIEQRLPRMTGPTVSENQDSERMFAGDDRSLGSSATQVALRGFGAADCGCQSASSNGAPVRPSGSSAPSGLDNRNIARQGRGLRLPNEAPVGEQRGLRREGSHSWTDQAGLLTRVRSASEIVTKAGVPGTPVGRKPTNIACECSDAVSSGPSPSGTNANSGMGAAAARPGRNGLIEKLQRALAPAVPATHESNLRSTDREKGLARLAHQDLSLAPAERGTIGRGGTPAGVVNMSPIAERAHRGLRGLGAAPRRGLERPVASQPPTFMSGAAAVPHMSATAPKPRRPKAVRANHGLGSSSPALKFLGRSNTTGSLVMHDPDAPGDFRGEVANKVYDTLHRPEQGSVDLNITYANNKTGRCSGTLIGARFVLTAGHCLVSDADGKYAKSIQAYVARDGTYIPFGRARVSACDSTTGKCRFGALAAPDYVSNLDKYNDWGLITLDRAVPARPVSVAQLNDDWDLEKEPIHVTGYPAGGLPAISMWDAEGAIVDGDNYSLVFSNTPLMGGFSGAGYRGTSPTVYAVHSGNEWFGCVTGAYPKTGRYGGLECIASRGVRISEGIYSQLAAWQKTNRALPIAFQNFGLWWNMVGGGTRHPVTLISTGDHLFDAFWIDAASRRVMHQLRDSSEVFHDPEDLKGETRGGVAALPLPDGGIQILVSGSNGSVWERFTFDGTNWGPWNDTKGPAPSTHDVRDAPTIVAVGSGTAARSAVNRHYFVRGVLFYTGTSTIFHGARIDGRLTWEQIPGAPESALPIAAVTRSLLGVNAIDIFVRADDGSIQGVDGVVGSGGRVTWGNWVKLGKVSQIMDRPVVMSPTWSRIDVFAVDWANGFDGSNKELYVKTFRWDPSTGRARWSDWMPLGAPATAGSTEILAPPAIVLRGPGDLGTSAYDIFAVGADGAVYHREWKMWHDVIPSSDTATWNSLGGSMVDIAAIGTTPGRVDLVARGTDGNIYHLDWSADPAKEFWFTLRAAGITGDQFAQIIAASQIIAALGKTG